MRGFKMPREFYIPKGSVKVADKLSDAIAYLWNSENSGKAGATVFFGKQAKPVSNFVYRDAARRDQAVADAFKANQDHAARKQAARDERKNFSHSFKIGDLFYTSWGYDQTNIDYYQIVDIRGKMLTVRAIGGTSEDTGWMQGKSKPVRDAFLTGNRAKTFRVLAHKGGFKVDGHYASQTSENESHGWTSYH